MDFQKEIGFFGIEEGGVVTYAIAGRIDENGETTGIGVGLVGGG